jgi:predicted anti-sigma-YlaC factor YlaD
MAAGDLDCNEIVELVTDYLEGAMDAPTAAAFEAHLTICEGCRRYLDQIRRTIETTGAITGSALSPQTEAILLDAFRGLRRPVDQAGSRPMC